jgi:hypothetical protein
MLPEAGNSSEAAVDVRGAAKSEEASGLCALCSAEQELLAWSCKGTLHTLDFLCPFGVTRSWEGAPPKGLYGARGPGVVFTGGLWREGDPGSIGWGADGFAFAVSPRSVVGREWTNVAPTSVALFVFVSFFFFVSGPVKGTDTVTDCGRLMPPHSGVCEVTRSSFADVGWSVSGMPGCSSEPSGSPGRAGGGFCEKAAVGWSSPEISGRPCWANWPSTGRGSNPAEKSCDLIVKKVAIAFFPVD